jgi:hypothetical protein
MATERRKVIRTAPRKTMDACRSASLDDARTRSGRCTNVSAVGRKKSASIQATATL